MYFVVHLSDTHTHTHTHTQTPTHKNENSFLVFVFHKLFFFFFYPSRLPFNFFLSFCVMRAYLRLAEVKVGKNRSARSKTTVRSKRVGPLRSGGAPLLGSHSDIFQWFSSFDLFSWHIKLSSMNWLSSINYRNKKMTIFHLTHSNTVT